MAWQQGYQYADMFVTGSAVAVGNYRLSARYKIQRVPGGVASSDVAFYLQTHPATVGGGRQAIAGPTWASMAAGAIGLSTTWAVHEFSFQVAELAPGASPAWIGSLYTDYLWGEAPLTPGDEEFIELAQRFPVLVSLVSLEKVERVDPVLKVTGARSHVRFA